MLAPIFVGGSGRSGTTITGRLIGSHPDYHMFPTELKFITVRGGLCDLVEGRTTYRRFEDALFGQWFDRGPNKGLKVVMSQASLEAALPAFRRGLRTDPVAASSEFVHRLLDPIAAANGARGWVEMTPVNAQAARTLIRLFPDMKLVHSVRDGRDVACSVLRFRWGLKDVDAALDWWGVRLERAFAATSTLPDDRLLAVQMEDLSRRDRERQYARLLGFLAFDGEPAVRSFFDTEMTADRAHIGRWRTEVPADRLASFLAHHHELAARLIARGFPYRPEPDVAPDSDALEPRETVAV